MGHQFRGRTALVTGAARGIGAGIAEMLARGGGAVVFADIDAATGEAVVGRLRREGLSVAFAELDVRRETSWTDAVAATLSFGGGFDILVNNAAVEVTTLIADADAAAFERLSAVNVTGVLLGMKHAFRTMRPGGDAGRGGAIVNLCSIAAQTALVASGPYAATKAAVERLTKVGAVEAARLGYGVRVNCVYPGFVRTELSSASAEKAVAMGLFADRAAFDAFVVGATPLGRTGEIADVAEAVAYLCSDAASYVTGVGLPVAGGMAA